ncbi:hypothetical protein SHO565_64330 [Streptomyces sp. HO565]
MRGLERTYDVAWWTVCEALGSAWPEPRTGQPSRPSTPDPYKAVIDGVLRADPYAPGEQRHTVTRIFRRLIEESGARRVVPDGQAVPSAPAEAGHNRPRGATRSGLPVS